MAAMVRLWEGKWEPGRGGGRTVQVNSHFQSVNSRPGLCTNCQEEDEEHKKSDFESDFESDFAWVKRVVWAKEVTRQFWNNGMWSVCTAREECV